MLKIERGASAVNKLTHAIVWIFKSRAIARKPVIFFSFPRSFFTMSGQRLITDIFAKHRREVDRSRKAKAADDEAKLAKPPAKSNGGIYII